MSILSEIGESLNAGDAGTNFMAFILSAAMTTGLVNYVNPEEWDAAKDTNPQIVLDLHHNMDDIGVQKKPLELKIEALGQQKEHLELSKRVNETGSDVWAYNSDEMKEHIWQNHLVDHETTQAKQNLKDVFKAKSDIAEINLFNNQKISEVDYVKLSKRLQTLTGRDYSQKGEVFHEIQQRYINDTSLTPMEIAKKIDSDMSIESTKTFFSVIAFLPLLFVGVVGSHLLGAGLQVADEKIEDYKKRPKTPKKPKIN